MGRQAEAGQAAEGRFRGGQAAGLAAMLFAQLSFSTSSILLKPLLDAGWSPTAAVAVRVALGGLILAVPALVVLRGDLRPLLSNGRLVLGYGLVAVAGTQVLYFAAVQRLPVAVALLIQYCAPVLIVVLGWLRGAPVRLLVVAGAVASVVGVVLVVDPFGGGGPGGSMDAVGVLLAAAAAVCLAGYYLLSAAPAPGLPPVALVSSGLLVGAAATAGVGLTGLLPLTASTDAVSLGGATLPWWLPLAVVAVVGTAIAYSLSLAGSRRLGSRLASFAGLTEVVFATVLAWLLLGERPGPVQLLGGACILAGIVLVRSDREPVTASTRAESVV
ncbi:EamA family transporter [Leifsonia sp. SIMBA_070]|uniref:EamA family transporter n=1 Tax=Leifsonia sp. SIMBA_070 TaxID=3085810 RepID=UPI00397A03C7